MKVLLSPAGVVTMEFPHLLRLIEETEFDTIYHEHFSYFSALTVERVFAAHGLRLFDVEELPTHGGSLRIYATHAEDESHDDTGRVAELVERERAAGLADLATYSHFRERVRERAAGAARVSRGCPRRRALRRGLRGGGEGRDAPELLRDRPRARRVRRRPQPAQAGSATCRASGSRSALRSTWPRRSPTTCCSSRGTSRTRSSSR